MMSRVHVRRQSFTAWVAALVFVAATCLIPAAASAQPLTIKMATLVPTNSAWFLVLKEVADKWAWWPGRSPKARDASGAPMHRIFS